MNTASNTDRARLLAVWAMTALTVVGTFSGARNASAQVPPEPPKPAPFYRQSSVNPYAKDKGNEQNRGRGASDIYWGVTNGNRGYRQPVTSRTPDIISAENNPGFLELDGWGYPRLAYRNGVFVSNFAIDNGLTITNPTITNRVAPLTTGAPASGIWQFVVGPSTYYLLESQTNALVRGYYRAPATPRPNIPPQLYSAAPNTNRFVYPLGNRIVVPGSIPGQQFRFQVRAMIPQPDPTEGRISDARYIVYYYIRAADGVTFIPKSKVFLVSQEGAGEQPFLNTDGQPAFFPFFSSPTVIANLPPQPDLGIPFQGVTLDDTTTNDGDNLFVLADGLNLVRSVDVITGTPTVTPPHGGRRAADARPDQAGLQPWGNGVQPLQPISGPQRQDLAQVTGPLPNVIVNPVPITAFDFVNSPDDPRYNPAAPEFDVTDAFDPANPSTLFRGPESLIEPRLMDPTTPAPLAFPYPAAPADLPGARVIPGTPNRPQIARLDPTTGQALGGNRPATSADSNNHNIYRFNPREAYNPPANFVPTGDTGAPLFGGNANQAVPFFSHMQVMFARTEYAIDPETGVSDGDKDGSLTIALGSVWCVDWLTGAPIWRFPDRTYAPGNARNPYLIRQINTAGEVTYSETFDVNAASRNPLTNEPLTLIPGVAMVDKNLDGAIDDDEVFIVGQGGNRSGAVFSSVTFAPRVLVRGDVQVPQYIRDATTGETRLKYDVFGGNQDPAPVTIPATPGRYYTRPNAAVPGSGYQPVEIGMAFITAANGVVYAVDAYGNNDNDYFPDQTDYRRFGRYRPGTTNVLWSFSSSNTPRNSGESLENYYTRLKDEVPGTGSFGNGAATLAYRRDERDFSTTPFNALVDRVRLFAGNSNGVLYAMDADADAGGQYTPGGGIVGVQKLPFRKEVYKPVVGVDPMGVAFRGPGGLKWWFQARGSIDSTPAISLMRQNAGGNPDPAVPITRKGVYFTSLEGRVYCIDWDGPVDKSNHIQSLNYDFGFDTTTSGPQTVTATATQLNDNYLFHNVLPATTNAVPDRREGHIRPRWTFPNLYRDTDADGTTNDNTFDDPADNAANNPERNLNAIGGVRLAEPETTVGPIYSSPVLIDFPWRDPLIPGSQIQHLSYVAFQAADASQNGLPPTEGRLYLLDQVGDRVNFLSNSAIRGTNNNRRVYSHPKDRFSPRILLGDATPTWTYRLVNDWYTNPTTSAVRRADRRNSPVFPEPGNLTDWNTDIGRGLPGRRVQPTLFIGGIGRVFAIDFDPETGLLMRWRPTLADTRAMTPLPDYTPLNNGDLFPGPEADRDRLFPIDPIFDPALANNPQARINLVNRKLLIRTVRTAEAPTAVTNLVVGGGPEQNRSTMIQLPPATALPNNPTVPNLPTNDAPNLRPSVLDPASAGNFDFIGIQVNQDINDPLSTSEGARSSNPNATAPDGVDRRPNTAYQFPMLFVTDEGNTLQAVSTNIEGEDLDTDFGTINESSTTGWALWDVSPDRFTPDHQLQFIVEGAGGPSGVSVVTNAYFPSLSATFLNTLRQTTNPADPFAPYQFGEPNTTSPTPYKDTGALSNPVVIPLANNDDPRPDFRPRSFSSGPPANPGPDGIFGTPDDTLAGPSDRQTGLTGFPLDLNGLFFDKRFAGRSTLPTQWPLSQNDGLYDSLDPTTTATVNPNPNTTTSGGQLLPIEGQHPNANYSVHIRLPGYSYIGGHFSADPVDNVDTTDRNNELPDGARSPRNTGNNIGDDINPSAQNVTWIFTGGLDGVLKAYTPAAPGQSSGFASGTQAGRTGPNTPGQGDLKIAIVDAATFQALETLQRNNTVLPDNTPLTLINSSIARRGGRNFYEYGEPVYIVAYDIAGDVPRVTFDIRGENTNTPVVTGVQRTTGPVNSTYTQIPGNPWFDYNPDSGNYRFRVALYKLDLGNPTSQSPQVPGDVILVTARQEGGATGVTQNGVAFTRLSQPPGVGPNSVYQSLIGNSDTYFAIANPLAVQGFLRQTRPDTPTGALLPVGAPKNDVDNTENGVGPFQSEANQLGGTKTQVADAVPTIANDGTTDPDKGAYDYSQALVNGNLVTRRDLRRFTGGSGVNARINDRFRLQLQEGTGQNRVNEPTFYFPVQASAGYIGHGETGSTDTGQNQQNLRILNRSLQPSLARLRVLPASDFILWRSWPGRIPNVDANLYDANGAVIDDRDNVRFTPPGMDVNGRINPLPWETGINETRPWNPTAPANFSADYPNIPARANQAVRVTGGGGNMTEGTGALPALVNNTGTATATNASVLGMMQPGNLANGRYATVANITVPKYQPANLVATHNLTNTYRAPSTDDSATLATGTNPGPLQLPRGNGIQSRDLQTLNPNGTSTGNRSIAPFGYSVLMTAFIDYDGSGQLYAGSQQNRNTGIDPNNRQATVIGSVTKAYREFEMSFGVPIDMNLKVVESEIDLGKLGHSFGMQNGLMGYGTVGNAAYHPGILPTPLFNPGLFPTNVNAPYSQFFKKFTIVNQGNVNFWNLRSSQRTEVNDGSANYIAGSGNTFTYFAMRSATVDPRFGILAVGADPQVSLLQGNTQVPNLTPVVVTSLDKQFDPAWNNYTQTQPLFGNPIGAGASPYQLYYQQLVGRHTLHKPRVGVGNAATLGIPDVPANQFLRPVTENQPSGIDTVVAAGVPLGTPVGEYTSRLASNPLVVFEDHDTNVGYEPTPYLTAATGNSVTIAAAGPFYAGSQIRLPGNQVIRSAGPGNGEGIWRARRWVTINGQQIPEYQPATTPGISVKLTVTEAPLTGEVADRSREQANIPAAIAGGRLPGVDFFPLIDRTNTQMRAAAALSPAAYRDANGNLHLYFSRNAGPDLALPFAQPGQPFRLFHSHLGWNANLGVFVASSAGSPLLNSVTGAPSAMGNNGSWFTPPQAIIPNTSPNESNVSPFVLQTPGGATLFWVNSLPTAGGQPVSQIFYTGLDANGQPTGNGLPLFARPDASIARYSPRVLFVDSGAARNAVVFYYGGSAGKWGLYYAVRQASATGTPIGTPVATDPDGLPIERPLALPAAIASATDPTPVLRQLQVPDGNGGLRTALVVDVYYTGVSRATQTPDVYMTRYEIVGGGRRGVVLRALRLPSIITERLTAPGRDPIYQARHIGWFRSTLPTTNPGYAANLPYLPTIFIGPNATTAVSVATPDKWQTDTNTGVLYQSFVRGGQETIVYVDAAAGTVRFRGNGAPRSGEYVFASYQPQTYRVTVGGVSNVAPYGFVDNRAIPATTALQSAGVVIRRTNPMVLGRHWLFWQRGGEGNRAASLYYAVRRVGVDLKDPSTQGTRLAENDTIQLSTQDAQRNQLPLVASVTVAGVGNVPFEVDYITGRVYVEPQYEGLQVQVQYVPTSAGPGANPVAAQAVLAYIDELAPTGQGTTGILVPINRSVNEGQPYAFLDTFNAIGSVQRGNPNPGADPTLSAGRIWLFWSSPRGRSGAQLIDGTDAFPGGFDLYWQTLAPLLDPLTPTTNR